MSDKRPSDSTLIPPGLPANPSTSFDPGKTMIQQWLAAQMKGDETVELTGTLNLGTLWGEATTAAEQPLGVPPPGEAPYELRNIVGSGGFGEVWEAIQVSLGRVIAVKRLRPSLVDDYKGSDYIARHLWSSFRQEALTTGALEHPNIVPVYDLGLDEEGRPLMAMKLVRGEHWDEVIREDFKSGMRVGPYLAKHIPILLSVAQAVAFAHSRGVVHRDIKPSQVMLGEFGEVLLMDWGLALVFDTSKAELQGSQLALSEFTPWSPRVTSPAGTPSYMAPEQTEETAVEVGPETDVYLLGGCLYLLLTGRAPHEDATSEASFERAVEGMVFEPEQVAPSGRRIPRDLSRLAMRALSRERQHRPSARAFIDALLDYQAGSGKRQEAAELLEQAELLSRHSWAHYEDYSELGELTGLLDRVLVLDPDNPRAVQLQQQALIHFARIAISNNDFRLAGFQANRLAPGRDRDVLLEEIERLQKKQLQAQRSMEHLYQRTIRQRDADKQQRKRLESAMQRTLAELFSSLEPLGLAPLLRASAVRMREHIEESTEERPSRDTIAARIATLRLVGDVFAASGAHEEAVEAYRRAEQLIRECISHDPRSSALTQNLVEIEKRLETMNVSHPPVPPPQAEVETLELEELRSGILEHLDEMLRKE